MTLSPGQPVVCVDNANHHPVEDGARPVAHYLKVGRTYVVRRASSRKHNLVWLEGVSRRRKGFCDTGFLASRFRIEAMA